ncbi:MAG: carbohydrate-binding protein [Spirochaetales bacterium]|nr:carbohydrate-binding protein [Spirochaetales bacterium]
MYKIRKKLFFIVVLFLFTEICLLSQVYLPPGETVIIQAEDVTFTQAAVESDHPGYTGSGYVNFNNEPGGYIEWSVSVSSPGDADCVFIYANASSPRPVEIMANGSIALGSIDFPGTGEWTTWSQVSAGLSLNSGVNTIRLTGTGSEGGPNLDRLDITMQSGSPIDPGDVNGDNSVDIVDALLIAQHYVGLNPDPFTITTADVNCDSSVDIVDALLIAQYYVGLLPSFSPCTTPAPTPESTPPPAPVTPAPTQVPSSQDLYVSPDGSASAEGTINTPTTLDSAISRIADNGTIWMRGGTYNYSSTIVIPEGNNGKKLYAYGSETPVIDYSAMSFSSSNRGVVLAGNNWHIRDITIRGAGDNGMLLAGHNNTIENCLFSRNRDSGLQLSRYNSNYNSISQWPSNNLILNCISRDNYDTDNGEDADGFAPKLTCGTGNIFRGCKALYNVDDGVDCYTKSDTGGIGAVRFENCEASNNGQTSTGGGTTDSDGNGFKLGDDTAAVQHYLINCVANNNKKHGYTGNGNPGPITLINCTGTGNGGALFDRL